MSDAAQPDGSLAAELVVLRRELAATQARLEQLRFGLAHDLKAPLRHIDAFAQVIEEDHGAQLEAPLRGHLATIQEAARQASALLDKLLSPSGPL